MEENNEVKLKIVSMNKTQLANHYKISVKVLNKWLKPFNKDIGPYRGRCFTVKQIKVIFSKLGND